MREGDTYNVIIIASEQSTKVFSAKFSFCIKTRRFFAIPVFSPGRFGISGRYPLRAEGISADTPCVCTALAQRAATCN